MSRAGTGIAVFIATIALLSIVPSGAIAACGGFANDSPPPSAARHAETIVLARVAGPSYTTLVPREPNEVELVPLDVLRVLRGDAEDRLDVASSVLSDCTHPSDIGDRIVVAFAASSPEGAYVGKWHEGESGRWWHHFDGYRSLSALLRALEVLPDTATALDDEREPGPVDAIVLTGAFAAWVVLALVLQVPLRFRRST